MRSFSTESTSDKISIGFLTPLTGNPLCGKYMTQGLELAKQNYPSLFTNYEFLIEDTQFKPTTAVTAAKKLIEIDQVHYIIGPCGSSSVLAVAPLAESNHVLLFTSTAFAESISDAGDYIFRAATTASDETPVLSQFIADTYPSNRTGLIYLDNDAGVSYKQLLTQQLPSLGNPVVLSEAAAVPETDFRTVLAKMQSQEVEVLILATLVPQSINIKLQAAEMGLSFTFVTAGISSENSDYLDNLGDLAEDTYTVSMLDFSDANLATHVEARKFFKAYQKNYPEYIPTRDTVQTYVTTLLLLRALEACGDNVACAQEELYALDNLETALGTISVNPQGDVKYPSLFIKKVEHGSFVRV